MTASNRLILDASLDGKNIKKYKSALNRYIIGQERAKKKIIEILLSQKK